MRQKIIKDAKFQHAWVTREQGIELENLIQAGGSEIGAEIIKQVEQLDDELQDHKTEFTNFKETDFATLKKDESELGSQVANIQHELSGLVRKDTTLDNLCKIENCAWSKDIVSQIESNARAIKSINDTIGNGTIQKSDLLFSTTKEITIKLQNQQMVGSMYWYEFTYNIEEWDNAFYNLEGLMFKNIHKDDSGNHGQVEPKTRKLLVTLTYDETTMYGTIQTPNMLDNGSTDYKLEVTCLWKKVLGTN